MDGLLYIQPLLEEITRIKVEKIISQKIIQLRKIIVNACIINIFTEFKAITNWPCAQVAEGVGLEN